MKRSSDPSRQLSFEATLENWAEGMDYCAVPVPATITEALGTRGPVLVTARLNDSAPFTVSLFPIGGGQHYIRIKAKVRKETRTTTGDRVRVRITVLDRSAVTYPEDLLAALRAEEAAEDFTSLPPGRQNFILRLIDEAVKPATRRKRIQDAVGEAQRRKAARVDRGEGVSAVLPALATAPAGRESCDSVGIVARPQAGQPIVPDGVLRP